MNARTETSTHYPVPGSRGGVLIRKIVQFLRSQGLTLPMQAPVVLAVSGGVDSLAMAHLMIRYGRRIVLPRQIVILHLNHGWRVKESAREELRVKKYARQWGVPILIGHLDWKSNFKKGESPEHAARRWRKKMFQRAVEVVAKKKKCPLPVVFTGHHGDDLAETLIWRFFTGAFNANQKGIHFSDGVEIRPLLSTRKSNWVQYAQEEKLKWFEDETNYHPQYLRAKMRTRLIPEIEAMFPKAIPNLMSQALNSAGAPDSNGPSRELKDLLSPILREGHRLKRNHWVTLMRWMDGVAQKKKTNATHRLRRLDLPGGWQIQEKSTGWVLNKIKSLK